jgi:hypothetical protein
MTTYFVSNAGSNTSPFDTEAKAANALSTVAALWTASDTVKLSSTHTETAVAALTYTFPTTPGLKLLSVTFNGSGTGGLAAGAAVNVGAASAAMTLGTGFVYGYGITFAGGTSSSSSNSDINIGAASLPCGHVWDSCTFSRPTANTGAQTIIGSPAASNNDDAAFNFANCTFSFGGANGMTLGYGRVRISNMVLSGTAPTTLFDALGAVTLDVLIDASDLSNLAWTNILDATANSTGRIVMHQCKLRAFDWVIRRPRQLSA